MTDIIAIIVLGLLLIGQLIERYFYTKDMTKKLSEAMKAVMSRNITEFMAVTQDKSPKQEFTQSDNVLIDEADDEIFDKFIEKQNI